MNYIYDIYLNFNEYLYDFFDWNKNDKLIHVKTIPIFKTNEKNIRDIITHNIKLDKKFLNYIYNKTTIWGKYKILKNYALFCDQNNVVAVEFDNKGNSIKKSYLLISDELEILETMFNLKSKNIEYKLLNKSKNTLKTRNQIKEENFIKNELLNIDDNKLNYIYFECFGKYEKNKNKIINKLSNMSKNSKTYKNLYNILKLTSTNNK